MRVRKELPGRKRSEIQVRKDLGYVTIPARRGRPKRLACLFENLPTLWPPWKYKLYGLTAAIPYRHPDTNHSLHTKFVVSMHVRNAAFNWLTWCALFPCDGGGNVVSWVPLIQGIDRSDENLFNRLGYGLADQEELEKKGVMI